MHDVNTSGSRIWAAAALITIIVIASVVAVLGFPEVIGTRLIYFDVNNGKVKKQWLNNWRGGRESVEDTAYSRLLRKHGFKEHPARWELAHAEELGLRRLFFAQQVSYVPGKLLAASREFCLILETKKPENEETIREISTFKDLLEKENYSAVKDYLSSLNKTSNPVK
jgi:hypothetical protein